MKMYIQQTHLSKIGIKSPSSRHVTDTSHDTNVNGQQQQHLDDDDDDDGGGDDDGSDDDDDACCGEIH